AFRTSISEAFLPMTRPALAVQIVTSILPLILLMTMLEAPWQAGFFFRYSRSLWSSIRREPNSCLLANHFERQFLFRIKRKPIGLTFCPTAFSLFFSYDNGQVACFLLDGV